MLDVMSGGRLVAGMVIGGGPEYFTYQRQPDHRAREVPRGPRPDHQGVDEPGPVRRGTASTTSSATSTPGRGRSSSRTRRSGSPAPAATRRSSSSPSGRFAYMGIPYFHIDVFKRVFDHVPRGVREGRATRRRPSRWAGACRSTSPRPTSRPARSSSRTSSTSSTSASACRSSSSSPPATSPRRGWRGSWPRSRASSRAA